MAYEAEIELLRQFAADLQRVIILGTGQRIPEGEQAEQAALLQSLHRRPAAVHRAVVRSGVNYRMRAQDTAKLDVLDVLETWHQPYVKRTTIQTIERAIGAYESGALPENDVATPPRPDPVERVRRILERLPRAARGLRDRYDGRETLKMDDEYDVQDLLRGLLVIDFEDVRKEEWTPSYAGKAARMDLLLKPEQIVIEVKITRPGRTEKQIGDELIVDIERYQAHPDCKSLVCFVFDPTFQIGNPAGLERDLAKDDPIKVQVIVAPKH